jgi:hypothetical protein
LDKYPFKFKVVIAKLYRFLVNLTDLQAVFLQKAAFSLQKKDAVVEGAVIDAFKNGDLFFNPGYLGINGYGGFEPQANVTQLVNTRFHQGRVTKRVL